MDIISIIAGLLKDTESLIEFEEKLKLLRKQVNFVHINTPVINLYTKILRQFGTVLLELGKQEKYGSRKCTKRVSWNTRYLNPIEKNLTHTGFF